MTYYDFFMQVLIPLGQLFESKWARSHRGQFTDETTRVLACQTQDALNLLAVRVASQQSPYSEADLNSITEKIQKFLIGMGAKPSLAKAPKWRKFESSLEVEEIFKEFCKQLRGLCWAVTVYSPHHRAEWLSTYATGTNPFSLGEKTSHWRTLVRRLPSRISVLLSGLVQPLDKMAAAPSREEVAKGISGAPPEAQLKVHLLLDYLENPREGIQEGVSSSLPSEVPALGETIPSRLPEEIRVSTEAGALVVKAIARMMLDAATLRALGSAALAENQEAAALLGRYAKYRLLSSSTSVSWADLPKALESTYSQVLNWRENHRVFMSDLAEFKARQETSKAVADLRSRFTPEQLKALAAALTEKTH
jgi:hypothetical protein